MQRQLPRILAVAVVGAVVALGPTAAGASVVSAAGNCRYLKPSEVAGILHTAVKKAPNAPGRQTRKVCGYVPKQRALPAAVNVWVSRGSEATIAYTAAKNAFKQNLERAPGLGNTSFYVGGLNTAYVLRGSTLVYVQYINIGGDPAVTKAAVLKLTKIVLGRV